ncbi:MAG: Uncharacterised protein [Flavobacteriaceae bacterium]|nr:MAG: Uncharacterised protein [Flavobacteriaceae bacterium]
MTTSAPNLIGERLSGEKVLSTSSCRLCFFAMAASPFMSAISNSGLLTHSQNIILVFGVIAASTASKFVISTKEVSILSFGVKFFKKA